MIAESHPDIRLLFEHVVKRLGHEPVLRGRADVHSGLGAAVIEPSDDSGLSLARRLRMLGCPVVFASIFPAQREALELEPIAYLLKPFALRQLEAALATALACAQHAA